MRVATKLTIAFCLTGMILFGIFALYLLASERQELFSDEEADVRLLGRVLQVSVENALRDDQIGDVRETLRGMKQVDPELDVGVHHGDELLASTPASSWQRPPALEAALLERVAATAAGVLMYDDDKAPRHIAIGMPLCDEHGAVIGAVTLSRPLTVLLEDLRKTRLSVLLTVVAFVVLAALVGMLLGHFYVGLPLARLGASMRAVPEHPARIPLAASQKDEISRLAQTFNAMVDDLGEAQARLAEETEQRRSLERGIERADRLASVGRIAAGTAHEIGSPLQVLIGRAQSLAEHPDDPEKVRRNARLIAEQGERIAGIVDQLLDYARRKAENPVPVDMPQVVHAVVELIEFEARRAGIDLSMRTAGDLPPVQGEPGQIQQIAFNLIQNALEACAAGDVITVELRRGAGASERPGETVVLTVEDTGSGIPPEDLEAVFEPFHTTRSDRGGLGLGLAVVRTLVEEHGGRIGLASEPGAGTSFEVEFPADGNRGGSAP